MESIPKPGGWSTFAVYFSIGKLPNFRSAVKQITADTLIIHGKDDILALKGSEEYGNIIPNAKFVSIRCHNPSGISGHFFFDDCPAEFGEVFLRFIKD